MNLVTSQFWDSRKGTTTYLALLHVLVGFRQQLEHELDSRAAFYF